MCLEFFLIAAQSATATRNSAFCEIRLVSRDSKIRDFKAPIRYDDEQLADIEPANGRLPISDRATSDRSSLALGVTSS